MIIQSTLAMENLKNKILLKAVVLICALATASSYADEGGGPQFSGSGFMTIAIGKTLSGSRSGNVGGYNCPCYVTDFAQAAIYDGRSDWQLGPDSKLGLQGDVSFDNHRFSITTQVVTRGANNGIVDLEWLYASYKLNNEITLQVGRQRLPTFYYSASQDIGFALPWTHLPVGVYGWEVVNYNGASVKYKKQFGDWTAKAELLVGSEHNKDSGYWKVNFNGPQSVTDVKWTNIVGGNLTLTNDWFETRLVYFQNNTQDQPVTNTWDSTTLVYDSPPTPAPVSQQRIYGLAVKADYQNWQLYSEFITFQHPGLGYDEFGQNVAAGYRFGRWLPMFTWSGYKYSPYMQCCESGNSTISQSLRYDLTTSSDLKLEYDTNSDYPANSGWGKVQLLTFAYDKVF